MIYVHASNKSNCKWGIRKKHDVDFNQENRYDVMEHKYSKLMVIYFNLLILIKKNQNFYLLFEWNCDNVIFHFPFTHLRNTSTKNWTMKFNFHLFMHAFILTCEGWFLNIFRFKLCCKLKIGLTNNFAYFVGMISN